MLRSVRSRIPLYPTRQEGLGRTPLAHVAHQLKREFEAALKLALRWPYCGRDKRGKCRGIARTLPRDLPGKIGGQGLSGTCPGAPERHSDVTEGAGPPRSP